MNRAICDPNYKPAELYLQIEALLLFYDQVLLYAPSQDQILRAGLDWHRLERLITEGFVVPVGREFWFDPKERDALSVSFANNPEKSATYRWSDLDETILKIGPLSTSSSGLSRGFLRVNDDHRHFAEEVESNLLELRGPEFSKLVEQATWLQAARRLPNELLHGPLAGEAPEKLAARLAFYAAGDLRLSQNIGVSSIFSTPEMGEVYRAVARSFAFVPEQPPERLTVVNPFQEYNLSPDELQIASRLALQIIQSEDIGPLDLDLLAKYRQTSCWKIFRDFVAARLGGLGPTHSPQDEERLRSAFEVELDRIGRLSIWGPWAFATVVGVGGKFLVDQAVREKPISRRGLFTILAGLSLGLFGKLLPNVATAASAELVDPSYRTLFVLVRQQQERKRRGLGF